MTVAELAALGTVAGVGFAIFLAVIGASVAFGKLSQRVTGMDARFDSVDARFDGVDARLDRMDARFDRIEARMDRIEDAINELRAELRQMNAEIQQTNRILVGLANHRHDTDGNTAFTVPQA